MASALFWLSDAEWAKLEPLMPRGRRGAHRVDDRRVISGIVHMLRSGGRWRDCPGAYGPYTTIYNRFNRWSRRLSAAADRRSDAANCASRQLTAFMASNAAPKRRISEYARL